MNNAKLKNTLIFLIPLFIFSYFFTASFAAAPDGLKNAIEEKNKYLKEVDAKIKETQKDLDAVKEEKRTLQKEIGKIDSYVKQLGLNIQSGEIAVDKLKLEIDSLQYDIGDAEREMGSKKETISKILRELQEKDAENPLIILLKNKSLAESFFEIQNLADLNADLDVRIKELAVIKEILAAKFNETLDKKQKIETETVNLKNRKVIVNEQKSEKNIILKETKNKESLYQKQLGELEKQQEEIGKEIEELEYQLRISFDPNLLPLKRSGVLDNPVGGPNGFYVTQDYGETSFAKRAYKSKFHNGVDLRASIGTPVTAAEDGKVTAVDDNDRVQYGRYIVIEHSNNLATLYAHLSRQIVKNGEEVKRGQIIGYSGNTGYSFAPHLHFTVYWGPSVQFKSLTGAGLVPIGATINPLDYL